MTSVTSTRTMSGILNAQIKPRAQVNILHSYICLSFNLIKDMVVRILMVALFGR